MRYDENGMPLREDVVRRAGLIADARSYTPAMKEDYLRLVANAWDARHHETETAQEIKSHDFALFTQSKEGRRQTVETIDPQWFEGQSPQRQRDMIIMWLHPRNARDLDRSLSIVRRRLAGHQAGAFFAQSAVEMVRNCTPATIALQHRLMTESEADTPFFRTARRIARTAEAIGGRGCLELNLHPDSPAAMALVNRYERRLHEEEAQAGRRLTLPEASIAWDEEVSLAMQDWMQRDADEPAFELEGAAGGDVAAGGPGRDTLDGERPDQEEGTAPAPDRGLDWRPADGALDAEAGPRGDLTPVADRRASGDGRKALILKGGGGLVIRLKPNPKAKSEKPWYEAPAASEVGRNETVIKEMAGKYGLDPNLIRALIYIETTHGYYDAAVPDPLKKSRRPMQVNTAYWGDAWGDARKMGDPRVNIEAGARLLKAITTAMPGASVAEIATIYNNLHATTVSDYGARAQAIYDSRAWMPDERPPSRLMQQAQDPHFRLPPYHDRN